MNCLCSPSPFLLQLPSPRHSQAPGPGFHFRSLSYAQLPLLLPPIRSRNPSRDQLDSELELDSESEEEEADFDEFEIDDVAAEDYIIHEVEYVSDDEDDEEGEGEGEGEGERFGVDEADPAVQSEDEKLARVNKFIAEVWEFGAEMIDYQELAGIYDFPIDKFQRLAIQAFLRGSSVVVSAPTSSGKTLIAEASALATLARKRRLFYTTPLKALSNQKFRDFKRLYGDHNVGLLTGDSAVNKNAPILIMTTEILRNMLYQSVGMASSESRLFHVDVIVLDEVHYLSDISRGTVWEEIVIYCPKDVQLICLSATVANPDELAGWIGQIHGKTELVTSNKRPVPLTWHFSRKNGLLPLLDDKGKKVNKKLSLEYLKKENARRRNNRSNSDRRNNNNSSYISKQALVPQIQDTINQLNEKDMLPAIWFIFSRKGCDAALQYLDHFTLLNECETSEVELEIRRFKSQYPDAVREGALKSLRRGITAHHAGCLPLWKSFIEELFQRGLIKVIFATETLAAGINMPARTAVIASLTKRIDSGRTMLSPNQLLQMAGRAGRRGIDKKGHVVLLQAHDVDPEECCDLLFKGVEPLVSQFKASYGMVLNLLAGSTLTNNLKDSEGRTLEEARKLIEQSFGNYVGSNVIVSAKEELERIKKDIEKLSSEITDEAMDQKCRDQLSAQDYSEISSLQEEIRKETKKKSELRKQMNVERIKAWKPLLEESENGNNLPFICLQYSDKDSNLQVVPAVFLGKLEHFSSSIIINMVNSANSTGEADQNYYVALSSDNTWYVFTEKFIKMVYRTGLSALSPVEGGPLPRDTLKMLLSKEESRWENLSDSESGPLFCMEGSLDTWSWSLNVPVLSSLQEDDEVKNISEEYMEVLGLCKKQRRKVSKLKKAMKNTKGFEVFRTIVNGKKHIIEQIGRLNSRSKRLTRRIGQIEPTGWKEFLQISRVIQETRAMDINAQVIYPLGETAAGIRGENELWLAMVIRNKILLDLKPAQLAAVCGSIVSEGIKLRPWKTDSYVYESTSTVLDVIKRLEEQKDSLLQIQERNGVNIPCELDSQFSGMVEAWASGLTWREIMMDCAMDEGDLARLLRRTIDLLAQIPKLPDIDPTLQRNASLAWNVMDRAPISELLG